MADQAGAGLQPPSSAVAGPGQIYAAFTLTGQWYQMVTDAGTLVSHAFQHVALTYSKSTGIGRIYRNGALVAEQTLGTFRPQTEFDVYLGRRPAAAAGDPIVSYHGVLDEVSIYSRPLSAAEIAALFTADGAGKCHPTIPPETNQLPVISIAATDPTAAEGVVMWCSNTVCGVDSNWFDPAWRTNCPNPIGTNTALFTVRRTGATNAPSHVYYSIGGTASNGLDYATLPGEITIPPGRRAAEIHLLPIDDDLPEHIETVVLRLRLPPVPLAAGDTPYTLGRPDSAAAYITDNDQPPPPCARLDEGTVHLCTPFTNQCFRLEISTNLIHWESVCTNAVADGAARHLDPDAAQHPRQFIRFIPVPCPPDGE